MAAVPENAATLGDMIKNKFLLNSGTVKAENYFCSGVIVFNLDALDEKFFYDGVQFLIDNPACESPDQDILNAFFSANYLKLDEKFDSFSLANIRKKVPLTRKVYHYAGQGIELNLDNEYNRLFMENFARTPWFNVDALGRVGETFRVSNDSFNLIVQKMIKVSVDHKRGFFVSPKNVEAIKMLLYIHDEEPIVEDTGNDSFEELVTKINENRGKIIFLICHGSYVDYRRRLIMRGFKEFVDFMNGLSFMTREQCGYMRPEWSLIRNM